MHYVGFLSLSNTYIGGSAGTPFSNEDDTQTEAPVSQNNSSDTES